MTLLRTSALLLTCVMLSIAGCDRKPAPGAPTQPTPSGGGAHSNPLSGGTTYTSDTFSYSLTYGPEWKPDPKEAARRGSPIAPADCFLRRSNRDTNFWICADKHPFGYPSLRAETADAWEQATLEYPGTIKVSSKDARLVGQPARLLVYRVTEGGITREFYSLLTINGSMLYILFASAPSDSQAGASLRDDFEELKSGFEFGAAAPAASAQPAPSTGKAVPSVESTQASDTRSSAPQQPRDSKAAEGAADEMLDLLVRKSGPDMVVKWLVVENKGNPWAAAIAACLLQDPPAGWMKYDEALFRKLFRPPAEAERALKVAKDAWGQARRERDNSFAVTLFKFAAERDVVGAAVELAEHLAIGLGTEQNSSEAIRWLTKAADARDPLGMRKLGAKYLSGEDVPPNPEMAAKWFRTGAEAGDVECMIELATMLFKGHAGVAMDATEAAQWATRAANAGNTRGMIALATACMLKRPSDDKTAFTWLSRAAQEGDADAMEMLAMLYMAGRGCERSEPTSVHWMHKAALAGSDGAMEKLETAFSNDAERATSDSIDFLVAQKEAANGNANAMAVLGMSYHYGRGVAKSESEGVKWLQKAAEAGHVLSMHWLAGLYESGTRLPRDEVAAANWYRRAALGGRGDAQVKLLVMYSDRIGVSADDAAAMREVQAKAERGNAHARFILGIAFFSGRGVEQSDTSAVKWLQKAAERGHAHAMYGMAMVAKTEQEKIRWWRQAAQLGDEPSKSELKNRGLSTTEK